MSRFDDFSQNIIDSHVHVGWYEDIYLSPKDVAEYISQLNISKALCSSLSGHRMGADHAVQEIVTLTAIIPGKIAPLLWLNPTMNWQEYSDLPMIHRQFAGFKLHPFADGYDASAGQLYDMLEYFRGAKLPVFAHTGNTGCFPSDYNNTLRAFKDITFVLYHGRPIDDAVQIALQFDNVYIETAYMEADTFRKALVGVGASKMIFGSDLPLDAVWYPGESLTDKYKHRVESYLALCTAHEAEQIFNNNISQVLNVTRQFQT